MNYDNLVIELVYNGNLEILDHNLTDILINVENKYFEYLIGSFVHQKYLWKEKLNNIDIDKIKQLRLIKEIIE